MDIYMGATKGGTRRKHSDEFRAAVLAECRQPGASIAGVALHRQLNANMLRAWLRKSELTTIGQSPLVPASPTPLALKSQQFLPVNIDQIPPAKDNCAKARPGIQLQLHRGHSTATVTWPSELASECGAWLREWLR